MKLNTTKEDEKYEKYDVVIIGAGLTGLTAAHRLSKQAGLRVALIEKENQVGGVIQSIQKNGYHLEFAANTFLPSAQAVLNLCDEINLTPVKASAQAKKRYIFHQGHLEPVPMSPLSLLTTPLLSPAGKFKLLTEAFAPKGNPATETVAEFTRRRLGPEVLDNLMGPFLSGVYAGDPEHLSIKAVFPKLARWETAHGSLIKGALNQVLANKKTRPPKTTTPKKDKRMLSFNQGMGELPQAIASQLPEGSLHLNTSLSHIQSSPQGYQLQLNSGERWHSRWVILATPAHVASQILLDVEPSLSQVLTQIPYVPMGIVHLGLNASELPNPLDGFGFLVPRKSGVQTLGSIWSSCLYPNRAPQGKALLTCFIGGALQPEILSWSEEEVLAQVQSDLSRLMGLSPSFRPDFSHVKLWQQAIPQYTLNPLNRSENHLERHQFLEQHTPPRLILAGNYRTGVSVNDCILQGESAAEKILHSL